MEDDGKLIIKDGKGEEKEYSILSTFDIEAKSKSYVLFTDYSRTEEGELRVYSAIYDKVGEDKGLKEVTEQDEIDIIDNYLRQLEIDLKSGMKLS